MQRLPPPRSSSSSSSSSGSSQFIYRLQFVFVSPRRRESQQTAAAAAEQYSSVLKTINLLTFFRVDGESGDSTVVGKATAGVTLLPWPCFRREAMRTPCSSHCSSDALGRSALGRVLAFFIEKFVALLFRESGLCRIVSPVAVPLLCPCACDILSVAKTRRRSIR